MCKACRHLGLKCEYKRPLWWSNSEQRKNQKELIKNLIKRTKLSEKNKDAHASGADSPPGLTHSLPTSATYSEDAGRTRATSEDSQYSFDFANPPHIHGSYDMYHPQIADPALGGYPHDPSSYGYGYSTYPPTPYEVAIKTERQMYVNDVPTRRDSTMSSFSTYHPPPTHGNLAPVMEDDWIPNDIYETHGGDIFSNEDGDAAADFNFFDFQHGSAGTHPSAQQQQQQHAVVQVDECDRHLLEHFIDNVLRLIFPVLEVNQHGSARTEVVLPALETNKTYLHCCLSIAAIHLKSTTQNIPNANTEQLDSDIVRHRYATVSELCEALKRDTAHAQILEATLGMIFFHCSVGRPDDCLPDIPWHQHFQAATSLVRKLDLPNAMMAASPPISHPPFNMTLTAWIDILGSTMLGQSPKFADTYREKHLSASSCGLAELMGCEDRMMYLLSEIACLDAIKKENILDESALCGHITLLGQQMDLQDSALDGPYVSAVAPSGAIRPRQLTRNMTAVFRKAARIYLLAMVPGNDRYGVPMQNLLSQFAELLDLVPSGPEGFDRSIVWPLLVAGAQSTPGSIFRSKFQDRIAALGEASEFGAFGRMVRLLQEVWSINDKIGGGAGEKQGEDGAAAGAGGEGNQCVHWRDVMRARGWDFLLI